jgi:hypothetical protein
MTNIIAGLCCSLQCWVYWYYKARSAASGGHVIALSGENSLAASLALTIRNQPQPQIVATSFRSGVFYHLKVGPTAKRACLLSEVTRQVIVLIFGQISENGSGLLYERKITNRLSRSKVITNPNNIASYLISDASYTSQGSLGAQSVAHTDSCGGKMVGMSRESI